MNDAMRAVGVFFAQRAIEPEPRSQFAVVFLSYFWCSNCSGQADQWIYDLPAKRNNCVMTELFLFVVLTIRHILWTADEDNSSVQRQPQRNAAIRSQLAISSFSCFFFCVLYLSTTLLYFDLSVETENTQHTFYIYIFRSQFLGLSRLHLSVFSFSLFWMAYHRRAKPQRTFPLARSTIFFYIPMLLLFSCPSSL